jgi:predicted DNA-binding transcriptional regulator AlpA
MEKHRMTDAPENSRLALPVGQAAQYLGLSASTLNKLRLTGDGPPYYKLSRRVVYRQSDLIAWLESHRRLSTSVAA